MPASWAGRFELRRIIGAGGNGVVYEAYDRERQARVALKRLQRATPEAITRLKREFRALEDLQHPNLVTPDALFEENGTWFFSMELVEGKDFLSYVMHDESEAHEHALPYDEARLRHALAQLANGLLALHGAGKIHRDIKPSNVLVTHDERVVLLDFGLVADVDRPPDWTAHAIGTAVYMAPEQAAGRPVGPEADWYAVGGMLYEALTNHPPYAGSALHVMLSKQSTVPEAPSLRLPGVASDLSRLCVDLLRIEPEMRPSGASVLQRLQAAQAGATAVTPASGVLALDLPERSPFATVTQQSAALFAGRADELAFLSQALEDTRRGNQVAVYVQGESGIGKTTLIRAFTHSLTGRDTIVLKGRCYARETMAYKAVDGVMEDLALFMRDLPAEECAALIPRRAPLLLRVFPALTRIEMLSRAKSPQAADPLELRTQLFAAFRELFLRLCEKRTVIISVDDLQWSDAESIALLSELLRPPHAPALLFIASFRATHAEESAGLGMTALPAEGRFLTLGPLSEQHATELAGNVMLLSGTDPGRARDIARAAAGHPMFINELARFAQAENTSHQTVRLEDAIWARIARLEPAVRRLIEVYALASAPLPAVTAARAASLNSNEFARHDAALRVLRLVRQASTQHEAAEPYHDSVRRAVRARLDEATLRELHANIAHALRTTGQGDLEALATHLSAAGESELAARHMLQAAEQAEHALAFGHAAHLYQRALDTWPEAAARDPDILVSLGDALANAGRGAEAARIYETVAVRSSAVTALELSRRAAQQLLLTGHIDEGVAALERVLQSEDITIPKTPGMALASVAMRRMALRVRGLSFKRRDESQVPQHLRARADLCLRASMTLGAVDHARAQCLGMRAVSEALELGEPDFAARAIAVYAGYLSVGGPGNQARYEQIFAQADALAHEAKSAHAMAIVLGTRGQARMLAGRFRAAVEYCSESERLLREQCVGVHWELDTAQLWKLRALTFLGELAEVNRHLHAILEECRQRRDLYGEVSLIASVEVMALLAQDRSEYARSELSAAQQKWSTSAFHLQHYFCLVSGSDIALYDGQVQKALALADEAERGVQGSLLKRVQMARINVYAHSVRATLACALQEAPAARTQLHARVARFISLLHKEKVTWGAAQADLALAALEAQQARPDAARTALTRALAGFEASEMRLHAACARQRLAQLLANDEGKALSEASQSYMTLQRIQNPERMLALLAPGFPGPSS